MAAPVPPGRHPDAGMRVADIPLSAIEVPRDRARAFDPAWAEALAAMIAAQGLLHPVTVRRAKAQGRWRLVAGLRRLEAARLLGWTTIPARESAAASDEAARLDEVMENLGRQDLTALDRCRNLWELKQAWDVAHPGSSQPGRRAGNGKSFPISDADAEAADPDAHGAFGMARSVAELVGLSKRAINLGVYIWTRLYPPVRNRLHGTPLADKLTELKALADLSDGRQGRVVALILDPAHPEIGNVAQALEHLETGAVADRHERAYLAAVQAVGRWDDALFDAVLGQHEERVIGFLKRRGRI